MIGHYLLTLAPEQEDRLLTTRFGEPCSGARQCLVMVVLDKKHGWSDAADHRVWPRLRETRWAHSPAGAYDELCLRFGGHRVNAAIRNRILANRARRALAPVREAVTA